MSERFVFTSWIKFDESHYELKCSDYFKQFDRFWVILRSILSMFKSGVLALVIPNVDQPRSQGPLLLGPRGEREREREPGLEQVGQENKKSVPGLIHCNKGISAYSQVAYEQRHSDYEQSLSFLGPSSKTPATRKWPRAWLKARDERGSCLPCFSRLAASPLNARARVHSSY